MATDDSETRKPRGARANPAVAVAREAARQLSELTGKEPETVTAISRTHEGWQVELDVLELHRVPETADVLATYVVDTDDEGQLTSYRRTRRYVRSQVQGGEGS
ncbi:MAG: gas vesicle protein [Streptosporangiales bacterium]|nr:gas vesicle protein [Streptosporangiales bacterium]MBO0889694.1 gas vesicle protein [Acidothermales bacterium]